MDDEIEDLLGRTSRTFALCIPMLPDSLHRQVGIAYLLFRVADTIEDSTLLAKQAKMQLLDALCQTLTSAQSSTTSWIPGAIELQQHQPTAQVDDADLFRQAARVIATAIQERASVHSVILSHVRKSAYGMRNYVSSGSQSGNIQLKSQSELRGYCYCVAGIVGEMLTELFLLNQPSLQETRSLLKCNASSFGEALQLVNILKDSDQDQRDGRRFIPNRVSRETISQQAREKLELARLYTQALWNHDADPGIVQFTTFPTLLASRTLDRIEADGPGGKVDRAEVIQILEDVGCTTIAASVAAKLRH